MAGGEYCRGAKLFICVTVKAMASLALTQKDLLQGMKLNEVGFGVVSKVRETARQGATSAFLPRRSCS